MSQAAAAGARRPRILWEVLEEHFDEGAYGLVCFARALESCERTLSDLTRYPEQRMIAQVDALLLGGEPVRARLLEPALVVSDDEDEEPEPERLALAAWALLERGYVAALQAPLRDQRALVRAALVSGVRHVRDAGCDAWLANELTPEPSQPSATGLMALAAARQLAPANLLAALQSSDPELVESAAACARHGESAKLMGAVQYLLEHDQAEVRDQCLLASLAWGAQKAWLDCKRWALDPSQPSPLSTLLYAALGTRADHEALLSLVASAADKRALLFVLGFTGNVAVYEALAAALSGDDPLNARIAAQSLGLLFGFSPAADEFSLPPPAPRELLVLPPPEEDPEAEETLPPLEADDLDADLVPTPEQELPAPAVLAITRHCEQRLKTLGSKQRLIYGRPYGLDSVAEALRRAPLRVRHGVALALGVRCAGSLWVDTRAATRKQEAQLSRIPALNLQRFSGF